MRQTDSPARLIADAARLRAMAATVTGSIRAALLVSAARKERQAGELRTVVIERGCREA